MKARVFNAIVLTSILTLLISACQDCNDCLDLTTKRILLQDEAGNNLWFGEQAVYNPENAQLIVAEQESLPLELDEASGTVLFGLDREYTDYYLQLEEGTVDTISFTLAQRKSERCCGMKTYSTQTFLNGEAIENDDLITITP